jgi:hypothetical protein
MTGSYRVTADGYAGPAGPVRVHNIIVKSTGTAAVVSVLNGLAGDAMDQINGTISQAVIRNYEGGLVFPLGCYIDLDANTSYVVVELEAI